MGKTNNRKTRASIARKQSKIKNSFQFFYKPIKKLENYENELDTTIFRYPPSPPHPISSYSSNPSSPPHHISSYSSNPSGMTDDTYNEKSEIERNYDAYNEQKNGINEKFEKFVYEKYQDRVNVINQIVSKIGLKLVKKHTFGSFDLRKIQENPNSCLTYFGYVKVFPESPREPVVSENDFDKWCNRNDETIPRTDNPARIEEFMNSKFCYINLEGIPEMMYINRFGPIELPRDYDGYDYHSYLSISKTIETQKELNELITEVLNYKEYQYGKNENVMSNQNGDWKAGGLTLTITDQMNQSIVIGKVNMENIVDYSQSRNRSDPTNNMLLIKPKLTNEGMENLAKYFNIKNKDVDDGAVRFVCKPLDQKIPNSVGKITKKERLFFNRV